MRHKTFAITAALSLLISLAAGGLWVSIRWLPQRNIQRWYKGALRPDGTRSQYILAMEAERFHLAQLRRLYPTRQN